MDQQWEIVKVLAVFTLGLALGAVGGVIMLAKHASVHQVYWAMGVLSAFGMFLSGGMLLWFCREGSDG